jgi:hypothetical protein
MNPKAIQALSAVAVLVATMAGCATGTVAPDTARISRLIDECVTFPALMKRHPVKDFTAFGAALYGGPDGIRRALDHLIREAEKSGMAPAEISDYVVRLAGAMYGFVGGSSGARGMQGIDQRTLRGFLQDQKFDNDKAEAVVTAISRSYDGAAAKCPMRR